MPYIKQQEREELVPLVQALIEKIREINARTGIRSSGLANFSISLLLNGTFSGNYDNYNSAIGVLECAKLEFYRRIVSRYEDSKIQENGDVF